ncbi:unnamed protein product [Nippostrongylus brasiliensis]|uniref:C2H2-type domain-containing protein n=1 Tax=Nippostrongylus brasiliensis TaxID=27835 RepID=A0A0N4YBH9_NIPBR|nr:unnamed protein product [Nippostrongylus brasiliensis]
MDRIPLPPSSPGKPEQTKVLITMSKIPARGFPLRTIGGLRYGPAALSAANLSVAPQRYVAFTLSEMAMCEEISYDEIYMPGELETDAGGAANVKKQNDEEAKATTETSETGEITEKASEEPEEEKKGASHPPNEIVEDVMRHVETELIKEKEKEKKATTTATASESSENGKSRKRSSSKHKRRKATRSSPTYSSGRSPRRSRRKHRRSSPKKRTRSSSSSSRGTYEGLEFFLPEDECPYACKQCHRGFYTIKELAEHEIRAHEMKILCAHCDRAAVSVTKLAAHMLFRHAALEVICYYCDQKFGGPAEKLDKTTWDDFRGHVYKYHVMVSNAIPMNILLILNGGCRVGLLDCAKRLRKVLQEVLKKKMYEHSSKTRNTSSDAVALRGVGRCPHGAAVKCKNFPNCPGSKCIYSHGLCRYDISCNKSTCPFDHTNRPRVCMACVNDMRVSEN